VAEFVETGCGDSSCGQQRGLVSHRRSEVTPPVRIGRHFGRGAARRDHGIPSPGAARLFCCAHREFQGRRNSADHLAPMFKTSNRRASLCQRSNSLTSRSESIRVASTTETQGRSPRGLTGEIGLDSSWRPHNDCCCQIARCRSPHPSFCRSLATCCAFETRANAADPGRQSLLLRSAQIATRKLNQPDRCFGHFWFAVTAQRSWAKPSSSASFLAQASEISDNQRAHCVSTQPAGAQPLRRGCNRRVYSSSRRAPGHGVRVMTA